MTSHFHHPVTMQTFPVNIPASKALTCLQLEDAQSNTVLIYFTADELLDLRDVLSAWASTRSLAA